MYLTAFIPALEEGTTILGVGVSIAAVWMLRRTDPDRPRARVPGGM
jgi:hypothetical protein